MSHICIYCDESCHLEHDHADIMVLGCIWTPRDQIRTVSRRLVEIKKRHNLPAEFEIKWTKVSASKQQFYLDLVDYFFDDDDLHFRALIIPNKSALRHAVFAQTHDDWYYKMYFDLLKVVIEPSQRFWIYLDIKDTRSANKIEKLRTVLCNAKYDFSRTIIERVQSIRSHESQILQLADLLIGAVQYANRSLTGNMGKVSLVKRIRERSRYALTRTTLLRENKVNIFVWHSSETPSQ